MKSEPTPFIGGPLDGRVLDVLVGPTGSPPKWYRVPVPHPEEGGEPTVLVYRRVAADPSPRLGLHRGWRYEYDPEGDPHPGPKWPWTRKHGWR